MRRSVLLLAISIGASGCAAWNRKEVAPESPKSVVRLQVPVEVGAPTPGWTANDPSARPVQIQSASFQKDEPKQPAKREQFELPADLPGANTPPVKIPDLKGMTPAEREKVLRAAYPATPVLPEAPKGRLPESGKPYTLDELQALALQKNPAIRRASANADAFYGLMIQAGLYPNPNIGYQADQIQPGSKPSNNAGQQGAFIQQLIKTAGKLSLQRAAVGMEYVNAQVALRRAQIDVMSQVRSAWFEVIVAEEAMKIARALSGLANEVYLLQIKQVANEAANHEPLQLYTQAVRAMTEYIDARNRYLAGWRRLAAALGDPNLSPHQVAGAATAPPPRYDGEELRQWILENHTDVQSARNSVLQTQYELRRAQVTPIPDIAAGTAIQHDNSTGNNQINLQIGIQLPLFDRNQGNIRAARGRLAEAMENVRVRQNDLAALFADAFARYQTNGVLVANYRDKVLPNLASVYRSTYQRHQQEPLKVTFNDIVVAQQNLAQALRSYLQSLSEQWRAVVELGSLLQIDDLFQPPPGAPKE